MKFIKIKKHKFGYIFVSMFILLIFVFSYYLLINKFNFFSNNTKVEEVVEEKISIEEIKSNYNNYVSIMDNSIFYTKDNDKYINVGSIHGSIEVSLDPNYEIVDEYFKLLNSNYYVKYDTVLKLDTLSNLDREYKYYKNYIPYNENIVLNNDSKLFIDNDNYYQVSGGSYPIIIKDDNRYGIEFNNRLVFVDNNYVKEILESNNTTSEIAEDVSVLNYHFIVSGNNENNELSECRQTICITDTMFDSHIKYLKDNGYYAVSLRDLEMFIDGKIQLPKRSVSITIDDGWYVSRSITILENYQMLGTLFLIGNLASPDAYRSEYLEIHSHTWDMHGLKTGDDCPSSSKRGGITCFDETRILEDLRKSRESLNNTTYLCYPFYDYSNKAIELLQEAGFTMAFAGQTGSSVKVGQDKFKIPRYVIYNYTSMNTFINYIS